MARTVDINLNHVMAKDIPAFGRVLPVVKDIGNVRYLDTGITIKRPGSVEKWDTTVKEPIISLIPEGDGYAINRAGNVFRLGSSIQNIHTFAPPVSKPTYIEYDGDIIVSTGREPINIVDSTVDTIPNVPHAKVIILINDHALYLGYHPTQFASSVPGNPKSVDPSFGARFYNIQKNGTILNATEIGEKLYIFKQEEIEVWDYRGGDPPFIRQPGAKIDKGLGAIDSLVEADERRWFHGDDGDFYVIEDFTPIKISTNYTRYLNEVTDITAWKGYDITKENVIMWVNQVSGKTLLYDYRKEKFLEDFWWNGGCKEAMPYGSYMELNNKQYYGSAKYDGKIKESSYDYKDDDGVPIRVTKEINLLLSGTGVRSRVNRLNFRRQANNATAAVPNPVFMVRTRFDKGPWSGYEHLTLGVAGDNIPNAIMDRIGIGREIDIEITATDAVDFLITNIYVTVEKLRN